MLSNWNKATTTTTGTGTLTLASVSGRPSPFMVHAVGEFVEYSIVTADGKFEAGIGKIGASSTLSRDKVLATFDGTTYNQTSATPISLSAGTHTVLITPLAECSPRALRFPASVLSNACVGPLNCNNAQANVAVSAVAQRATAYPFLLGAQGVLTAFQVNVSVVGTGSSCHLGLYEPSENGTPGRLLAKTASAIDTSTTGIKTGSVAANVRLAPGWYWAAVVVTAGSVPNFTGFGHLQNAYGLAGKDHFNNMRSDSSQTDLADPFPTASPVYSTGNNGTMPLIGLVMS